MSPPRTIREYIRAAPITGAIRIRPVIAVAITIIGARSPIVIIRIRPVPVTPAMRADVGRHRGGVIGFRTALRLRRVGRRRQREDGGRENGERCKNLCHAITRTDRTA